MKGVTASTGHNWRFKDETGKTFGRLTVDRFYGLRDTTAQWVCRCICGNVVVLDGSKLRSGHTVSCGCFRVETARQTFTTHGKSKTKENSVWRGMKRRCYNESDEGYQWYGARGIIVCERWANSFENFYADMGDCPDGLTLERIDCNGNYEPSNCKWATAKEQANNKRNTRRFLVNGTEQTIWQLEQRYGVRAKLIRNRLCLGWTIERAIMA